jgi:hypothetical protein
LTSRRSEAVLDELGVALFRVSAMIYEGARSVLDHFGIDV